MVKEKEIKKYVCCYCDREYNYKSGAERCEERCTCKHEKTYYEAYEDGSMSFGCRCCHKKFRNTETLSDIYDQEKLKQIYDIMMNI